MKLNGLKFLGALAVSCSIHGSALADEKVEFPSPFSVLEYNTVSNKYGERATFIKMDLRDKGDIGWIQADLIHKTDNAALLGGLDVIRIKEKHVQKYIDAVDKYLKWQKIALADGDVFSKEIAQANKVKFLFHSGNQTNHYLVMEFCAIGVCVEPAYYFDRANAELLKKFFEDWRDDALDYTTEAEVEEKYK